MKKIKYIFICLVAMIASSCNKDGDFLTTNGGGDVALDGSGDIVLKYENADALALTIYWTDNGELTLSNPLVQAPDNATTNTIQFSNSEDFAVSVEDATDAGVYSRQYTVFQLNAFLSKLNYEGNISAPLFIRVKSTVGNNIEATYSNVLKLNVTPYVIDMTVGYVLDKNQAETGVSLYSPNSDGVYYGFMGAAGWYNYYLREGDGTTWGNVGQEGAEFKISKDDTKWNFWFPGMEGCYYTIVDTKKEEWSALYIPTLTVEGDIAGEMTYSRKENIWRLDFNATATGSATIKISGTGKQYNATTQCDDTKAIDTPVAFSANGDVVAFGSQASAITVTIPQTGEVSLELDLNNPKAWTCAVKESGDAPIETPKYLYLLGIDDGISGSWTFNNTIKLYDEDNLNYAAACNVNSLWGYQIGTEDGNWSSVYCLSSGDAAGGTLAVGNTPNIPAPTPGLYLINASMKYLTYSTMAITGVSYSGINGDWTGFTDLSATATPGVYEAQVNITAASEWGFKIYLNGSWDYFFGGGNGELTYMGGNITYDASLIGSTCTLTVDLCKCTYTLTK